MFTICLYNFCVYRLPAGTNLQYFCTSVNQILTNILAIQILYFCKFAQNIWNWNLFLQFKCKRIANLSQNDFQTFCDEVQIYCTLVQSKCNQLQKNCYFYTFWICKNYAIHSKKRMNKKNAWIQIVLTDTPIHGGD